MPTKRISKVTLRQAQEALALIFPSVKATVAPNGSNEIWFKDEHGYGFSLRVSSGPAGIGATIHQFVGNAPLSVSGNAAGSYDVLPSTDAVEVTVTVYRNDEYSQQFKKWYRGESSDPNREKHPTELGMKPAFVN